MLCSIKMINYEMRLPTLDTPTPKSKIYTPYSKSRKQKALI